MQESIDLLELEVQMLNARLDKMAESLNLLRSSENITSFPAKPETALTDWRKIYETKLPWA